MTLAKVIKELFSMEPSVPKEHFAVAVPSSGLLQIKIYKTLFTINIADRLLEVWKGSQAIIVDIDDISYFNVYTTAKMHLDTSHFKVYDFALGAIEKSEATT